MPLPHPTRTQKKKKQPQALKPSMVKIKESRSKKVCESEYPEIWIRFPQ